MRWWLFVVVGCGGRVTIKSTVLFRDCRHRIIRFNIRRLVNRHILTLLNSFGGYIGERNAMKGKASGQNTRTPQRQLQQPKPFSTHDPPSQPMPLLTHEVNVHHTNPIESREANRSAVKRLFGTTVSSPVASFRIRCNRLYWTRCVSTNVPSLGSGP